MDRRRFLSTTVAGILAAPLAAEAQQKGKLWKIGALWTSAASSPVSSRTVLRQALRELGYVEGRTLLSKSGSQKICQSVSATSRTGSSRPDPTSSSLRALLSAKAFKERTSTIPIVIVLVCDPVGTGLISILARPGGNVTGLTQICPELNSKRLQIMKEALPRLSRVAGRLGFMGPPPPPPGFCP